MSKSKKHSSSKSTKSRTVNHDVSYQIQVLLGALVILFLLASVFDAAGSLGHTVYFWYTLALGQASWVFALVLLWFIARRYFPQRFGIRLPVLIGYILVLLGMTGLMHSFATGDPLTIANQGGGGGYLGYMVGLVTTGALGSIIGRLLLFVAVFSGLMLILDKAIVPFLHLTDSDDDNEDEVQAEARVPVTGEIKGGAFGRLKQKLTKPETATAPILTIKRNRMDGIQPLTRMANWNYPPASLLEVIDMKPQAGNIQKRMETIQKTLSDFGVEVTMTDVNVGPTVSQYTLKPLEGVKINQISARQDDLALALAAQSLRVEAPIPGKALVGIEIPNDKKAMVGLRDILESREFRAQGSRLAIALGRDAAGAPAVSRLEKMPHALIAGATGSGKSVAINSIIITLLMNNSPDELRMILVDPKRVELTGFNGIPHLLTPVITESKDTVAALNWTVKEMERRYKVFGHAGKRNIEQYNLEPDLAEGRMPFIVLIIDELADLMIVAPKEVENSIVRLAQMSRAVGIHLILATQRPSVDVITGLIKANIPTRIAFAVASQVDSRTILDMSGAEKLLGYGDMLYMSTEVTKPMRIQGVLVSEKEITSVIAHIKMQEGGDRYDPSVLETRVESRLGGSREGGEIDDELFEEAYQVIKQAGKASTTLLQTRLSVGYARAARLMQSMEDKGMIGPAKGSKPREVYGVQSVEQMEDELSGIAPYPED